MNEIVSSVTNAAFSAVFINAIGIGVICVICLAISGILGHYAWKWAKIVDDVPYNQQDKYIAGIFLFGLSTFVTVLGVFIALLQPSFWMALINPEAYLAYMVLNL